MTPEDRGKPLRGPAAPPEEALAARRRRAAEEPLDVRWSAVEPVARLEVRNPAHRTRYEVLFPAFPRRDAALCTCTDFARRGLGTCKHIEAAWSWWEDHPSMPAGTAPPPAGRTDADLWRGIDRGLEALARRGPTTVRDLERVGRLLIEPPSDPDGEGGPARGTGGRGTGGRARSTPTSRGRP